MFTVSFYNSRGEEIEDYDLEADENIWDALYLYESGVATDAKLIINNEVLAKNGEAILYFKRVKQGKKLVWVVKE